MLVLVAVLGTVGLHVAIDVSTMAVLSGHGAAGHGLLSSAVGAEALLSARRATPRFVLPVVASALFGVGLLLSAIAPSSPGARDGATPRRRGLADLHDHRERLVQLGVGRAVRGRGLALSMVSVMGGTVIGGPAAGWVANMFGPRQALLVGAAAGARTAIGGGVYRRRSATRAEPLLHPDRPVVSGRRRWHGKGVRPPRPSSRATSRPGGR